MVLNFKVKRITKKFLSAGFPKNFFRNTIEYFNKGKTNYIIPKWLFDKRKLIILRLPFSESNEKFTKSLIQKRVKFTNNKCKLSIIWNTRNMDKSLKLKIKLNTTVAWFRKVVVCVVEFMSVSLREIMF